MLSRRGRRRNTNVQNWCQSYQGIKTQCAKLVSKLS
ncbi:unnamed protein product [Arabidopsis halleri]